MKLDGRKKYFLVIDVETANKLESPLVYDIGYVISDKKGNIYEKKSYVVSDIFIYKHSMMLTAYYACKLPQYWEGLESGERVLETMENIWIEINQFIADYQITEAYAYNAGFDSNALNNTLRFTSKSIHRTFLPKFVKWKCIWNMACTTILQQKTFLKMAIANKWYSDKFNIRTSAEIAHRYLSGNAKFEEEHTGLEDVMIELGILLRCMRQHKKMDSSLNGKTWQPVTKKALELYGKKKKA